MYKWLHGLQYLLLVELNNKAEKCLVYRCNGKIVKRVVVAMVTMAFP